MEMEELLRKLKLDGALKTKRVENAFKKVNRADFVPDFYKKFAYMDTPLPIGQEQTISAPHMVAIMTELLKVKPGNKVLEVGSGSGYQAAVLLALLKGKGHVYTIERLKELSKSCRKNLKKQAYDNYDILTGDGSKGLKKLAPFDRIIVTASANKTPPALLEQLKTGGVMVIPVGSELFVYHKKRAKKIKKEFAGYVRFVPLIEE